SGGLNYISPNRPTRITGHIEETLGASLIRAQSATPYRPAYTLDGSGIGIAVMDSGIHSAHAGFGNRVVANVNFTSDDINDTADGYGHGTHVAGIAAGNSNAANGAYRGIAPNA